LTDGGSVKVTDKEGELVLNFDVRTKTDANAETVA
jgi:hypothetical protein